MNGNNSNVSFIPKSSLVREESFLERPRPRSVIGIFAIVIFVASVGSYFSLRQYRVSVEDQILAKTDEINNAQAEFARASEVADAKIFLSRASLAKELLDSHTLLSPVLTFISDNTVGSIVYDSFTFTNNEKGAILELPGEAPTYSALAYQGDVLRKKNNELIDFSIREVSLTKFGGVSFNLTLHFSPEYISYVNNLKSSASKSDTMAQDTLEEEPAPVAPIASSTPSVVSPPDMIAEPVYPVVSTDNVDVSTEAVTAKESALRQIWSKFKFW